MESSSVCARGLLIFCLTCIPHKLALEGQTPEQSEGGRATCRKIGSPHMSRTAFCLNFGAKCVSSFTKYVFSLFEGYSLEDVQSCTEKGVKVGANIYYVYLKVGMTISGCNAILKEIGGKHTTIKHEFVSFMDKMPYFVWKMYEQMFYGK